MYRSAPQITMSARPKGKPKAPKISFCTPGFCVLICTATTLLKPEPAVLQSTTPFIAAKHSLLNSCIADGSKTADICLCPTFGALALHHRAGAYEKNFPGLLGVCSYQGKLSTNGVAQRTSKRQVDAGQDAQQEGLPPVHEALQTYLRLCGRSVAESARSLWTGCRGLMLFT